MTYGVRLSILNIHFWKETDGVTCSAAMKSFTSIPKITEKWEIYRIAGNFQGRKLSRIGEKDNFHGENFRGMLVVPRQKTSRPQISRRKLLWIATKLRNLRKFSPSKVFRYTIYWTQIKEQKWGALGMSLCTLSSRINTSPWILWISCCSPTNIIKLPV